jgi:hypothetical protein
MSITKLLHERMGCESAGVAAGVAAAAAAAAWKAVRVYVKREDSNSIYLEYMLFYENADGESGMGRAFGKSWWARRTRTDRIVDLTAFNGVYI